MRPDPPSGFSIPSGDGDVDDERERLRALRATGLLDSAPERVFDALVQRASEACDAPMAVVSLVDEERQWFKARVGIDATQTPRNVAFCHYAILHDDAFVVEDATLDPRFASNPLVVNAPSIRFYAGMPLHTPEGHRIGTLCVLDRTPRELTDTQREALEELRAVAEEIIARRRNP